MARNDIDEVPNCQKNLQFQCQPAPVQAPPSASRHRQSSLPSMKTPHIILGSSSKYRRQLLEKLKISFEQSSPDVDETPLEGEKGPDLCRRLARNKAEAVARQHPQAVTIASDQCAALGETILGKPGTRDNAIAQLEACSGSKVSFFTAVCVHDGKGGFFEDMDTFDVTFRHLDRSQIERYVDTDQPLDCAGSFKSEGFGIALFSGMSGNDPNTLIGLPLIKLVDLLAKAGVRIL
jgi:MAF protein